MSKLFKFKEWLSLDDACKRLSTVLEEEVSVHDLIQLVIDNRISISWYFKSNQYIKAVEVVMDNVYVVDPLKGEEFLSANAPIPDITNQMARVPKGEYFRVFIDDELRMWESNLYSSYRTFSSPKRLEGAYKVRIDSGGIKGVLESFLFKAELDFDEYIFTGIIVEDDEGTLYKLVYEDYNRFNEVNGLNDLDDFNRVEFEMAKWERPPYPIRLIPKLIDLVILRKDLDKFEDELTEPKPITEPRTPTQILTVSLGIMTELLAKKTSQINKNKKLNFSQLSKEIEQEAATLGIELNEISNLQRDLSQAHKIIQKLKK
ncbi:hypothetical protein H4J58_19065 [Colwellia sp. MB3u-70]|uniref:hypothetical protein n=1 Tax=unclassified Colwellia TaxID=196834 RepID=UPI0015F50EB4|nr:MULTISPECIES: hypothetical protein [unclassified Colwellia]MBA6291622.1 hypothetical protein [Colwellia sp. MB3u-8]MBA6309199.1 hypothetical protein [Colwellia sp. MB3u-70]